MTVVATGLRERNKQRRVAQILEATRALLRERPDESPSVERIAARADVASATVFNLIGPREKIWAALSDEMLADLDRRTAAFADLDPHARARAIVTTIVEMMRSDAAVHRHLLAHWSQSGRFLRRDPTPQLIECLREASARGTLRTDVDLRRLGEMISTACSGAAHQWSAGLISDRALRLRCRTAVDVVFAAAAAPPPDTASPDFLAALRD
jgi:AcrR family transcriptional regulator